MGDDDLDGDRAGTDPSRREAELRALNRRRHIDRHRSLIGHWMGRWLRAPARPSVAPLPSVTAGQVGIAFAGHATVLVRYAELDIVCDPMLGARVKGVRRAVRPGISPAELQDAGLILISHAHADHLHRPTLARLPRAATVVLPPRAAHHVSDLGFARVVELDVGQSVQHRGVDIFTAPVRHGDGEHGALSYVIRGDGPSVYFCGDSGYFSGFAEIGRRLRPDIALLPIGGYAPLSFRDRHMTPLDALYAFEDLCARVMIPIHYGAFALSYEKLHDPSRWLAELVRQRELEPFVVELEPGQSRVFIPPRPSRALTDSGIPDADWDEPEVEASPDPEQPRRDEPEPEQARTVDAELAPPPARIFGEDPGAARSKESKDEPIDLPPPRLLARAPTAPP